MVHEAASSVLLNAADFSQESTGLKPLVTAQTDFARAIHASKTLNLRLAQLRLDPQVQHLLTREQRRYVDIAVERLDTDPFLWPVEPNRSLRAGGHFIKPEESR
jgi:hypothetical protein